MIYGVKNKFIPSLQAKKKKNKVQKDCNSDKPLNKGKQLKISIHSVVYWVGRKEPIRNKIEVQWGELAQGKAGWMGGQAEV